MPSRARCGSGAGSRNALKGYFACSVDGSLMPSDWFTAHAPTLPTEAEEIWRYSRISDLDLGAYTPAVEAGGDGIPAEIDALLASIGDRAGLAVTRNGHLVVSEGHGSRASS